MVTIQKENRRKSMPTVPSRSSLLQSHKGQNFRIKITRILCSGRQPLKEKMIARKQKKMSLKRLSSQMCLLKSLRTACFKSQWMNRLRWRGWTNSQNTTKMAPSNLTLIPRLLLGEEATVRPILKALRWEENIQTMIHHFNRRWWGSIQWTTAEETQIIPKWLIPLLLE